MVENTRQTCRLGLTSVQENWKRQMAYRKSWESEEEAERVSHFKLNTKIYAPFRKQA